MAEVNIHYFSGTGNTKRAVDLIAASLQKNGYEVKLYLIPSCMHTIRLPDREPARRKTIRLALLFD